MRLQQKYEEALICINKSIEIDSENSWNFFQKSLILGGARRYEEAIESIEKAYQLKSSETIKKHAYSEIKFLFLKKLRGKEDKKVKEFLLEMFKKRVSYLTKSQIKDYLNHKVTKSEIRDYLNNEDLDSKLDKFNYIAKFE